MPDIIISGPEGRLEGKYHPGREKNMPAALILHPHPLHAGTMNNKVVYNMYHNFMNNGFAVLRFNFRGVGRSEGEFDQGVGELIDAACALDWLQTENTDASSFWIAGFSFGAWISMQLMMRRPEVEGFVSVSPPVGKYNFDFLSPCPAPGLIIQGDNDSVVSEDAVSGLAEQLSKQKKSEVEYHVVHGADHFFRNHLKELNDTMNDYISRKIDDTTKPKLVKRDRKRRA